MQPATGGSAGSQLGFPDLGHAPACAGALAVQKVIEEDQLLDNCRRMGALLRGRLEDAFGDDPHVGDIRGRGLFLGIELVEDRAAKRPFDPALKLHARIKAAAMEEGLMVYPSGGTADGKAGAQVLIAPPFIVNETHMGESVEKLSRSRGPALQGVGGRGRTLSPPRSRRTGRAAPGRIIPACR